LLQQTALQFAAVHEWLRVESIHTKTRVITLHGKFQL
jgi:hypothetical protein